VNPKEAHDLIRAACLRRPELRFKHWPKNAEELKQYVPEDYMGYCYIASHAFSQFTGAEIWATEDRKHFWNVIDGEVWDLTKEQFRGRYVPYEQGHRVPRKNINKLPARVKELINECDRSRG
jgi:hypothetical protein